MRGNPAVSWDELMGKDNGVLAREGNSITKTRHHLAPRVLRVLPFQQSCIQMFFGTYWVLGTADEGYKHLCRQGTHSLKGEIDAQANWRLGYGKENTR